MKNFKYIVILALLLIVAGYGYSKFNTVQAVEVNKNKNSEIIPMNTKEIYLAGGCFWGVEKYFASINGVVATDVGYANGDTENPTYHDVVYNDTNHAETVHIVYNPEVVSLPFLLDMYYKIIDPTSVNKQGNDIGTQYRTGIYYVNKDDKPVIDKSLSKLAEKYKGKKIAIENKPLENYYKAEEYHQDYLDKNPNGYCHIGKSKFEEARKAVDTSISSKKTYSAPDKSVIKSKLTPMQYKVTQENGTEMPFQNEYWNNKRAGIYVDVVTGEPLFSSSDKFDSGTGWPSFTKSIAQLEENVDTSHGMLRTEVRSKSGDSHLGHLFNDGPKDKGGMRYCINSASLRFIPKEDMEKEGYGHLTHLVK